MGTTVELERIANGTKRIGDTYEPPIDVRAAHVALDGFTKNMTPPQRARAISALAMSTAHKGGVLTRKTLVEKLVAEGYVVSTLANWGRVLRGPTGSFIEQSRLTKTAMDYAEYLTSH